ncbi:hypothetical protein KZZ07_26375 [Mameliella sp. CS4]|uniref:hypothetical protein n=1 Tax=Mameliella sp. CS4 TaxID=2862329 RepID=UPI001C5FDD89|nr:hypothetical protein [Mameliella sp. CS4]MBW4986057.1 hypothetical protein [Mameliella sp. CS4]
MSAPGVLRMTLPLAHLRLKLAVQGEQGTWGLYPAEGHPAPDKPLVSGMIGGEEGLTSAALFEAAAQLAVFEKAMAEGPG